MEEQVYLAGSFTGWRDKVKEGVGNRIRLVDPRFDPQYAMYATNDTDLTSARESRAIAVAFPAKKTPGVMTMVELGESFSAGNHIIVADEIGFNDFPLNFVDEYYTSIDEELIPRLISLELDPVKNLSSRPREHTGIVNNIKIYGLEKENAPKHNKTLLDNPSDPLEELEQFRSGSVDLLVVGFPKNIAHSRRACLAMGMAEYHRLPIIMYTNRKVPYPPLTGGLQRRLFFDKEPLEEYLHWLETNDIGKEAKIMYDLFKKYDGVM